MSSLLITVSELLKVQNNKKDISSILFSPRKAGVILLATCLLVFFLFRVCLLHCTWNK